MTSIRVNAVNTGICFIRAVITPNAVSVKDGGSSAPITVRIRMGPAFSDNDDGPADRGDERLAKEPELPGPRNGSRRENAREQHGHRYQAGSMKARKSRAPPAGPGHPRGPGM